MSLLFFSLALATTSYTAYNYAREYLVLPSYSWLLRYFKTELNEALDMITNIDKIPLTLSSFVEGLGNQRQEIEKYGGFLAVDAISMRPHIFVRKDGIVEGLIEEQTLNDTQLDKITRSFNEYEKVCENFEKQNDH